MASVSPFPSSLSSFSTNTKLHSLSLSLNRRSSSLLVRSESNISSSADSPSVEEPKKSLEGETKIEKKEEKLEVASPNLVSNEALKTELPRNFKDSRWVNGTWNLKQFMKSGRTDWDSVIDAEARRRKWLEEFPEASSNEDSVYFDTSVIPWFAWIKRFHLPEAERLNGRAAMIGFFMAYFVDSLTGVGLVDQSGNFFCKTLLFISVVGVLLIRNNKDIETLKKVLEESTFYDKQWQATWQDNSSVDSKK